MKKAAREIVVRGAMVIAAVAAFGPVMFFGVKWY